MNTQPFRLCGVSTALVTPFCDGAVDYERLAQNIEDQIAGGIDGLVPVGTTGESPTLSHEEHEQVIAKTVEYASGRVPVIAGTGSNSTAEALRLTRHAKTVGAAAALMVNPYYNKPSQEGLYQHFMTIADAVDLPIVLYNIPGRTNVTMSPATVERLAAHANVVAVKEATGDLDMASEIVMRCASETFSVVSGDDSLTLPIMSVGGMGVISVLSNLVPARIKTMVAAALAGDYATAQQHHLALFPLIKSMFIETNPVPVKTAMAMVGKDAGELRLPLCDLDDANCQTLRRALKSAGVL